MRLSRYALLLSLITVAAAFAPLGTAGTTDTAGEDISALDGALSAFSQGGHADGYRALAASQGIDLPAAPSIPDAASALVALSDGELDRAAALDVIAQVPAEVHAPTVRLLVAIAQADALVDEGIQAHGASPGDLHTLLGVPDGWVSASTVPGMAEDPNDFRPWEQPMPEVGHFVLAQAILLDAIEEVTPQLETVQASCPPTDLRPYVILCAQGNTVYNPGDDAILILDVTGNDVYNNAQGTPFPVSGLTYPEVIVDVSGNDRYERQVTATRGTIQVVAQGAGVLGVGGILDLVGDDRYVATAGPTSPPKASLNATVIAQGAGVLGAGFLVDLAGYDCVLANATAFGVSATAIAQGAGSLGAGFAALLGSRSDDTKCGAGPTTGTWSQTQVLVDNEDRFFSINGPAVTIAQGAGELGAGALVSGPQAHTLSATADGGSALTIAQGAGTVGAGALVDLGGADTYLATSHASAHLALNLEGSFSSVGTDVDIRLGDTVTVAQGAGLLGAGGLLDVGLAGDSYEVDTGVAATAFSRAATTFEGGTTKARAFVSVGDALSLGQGAASTGAGLLVDAGTPSVLGTRLDDHRLIHASILAKTTAIAEGGAANTATAETHTDDSRANGQGLALLGAGVLADAGGNDAYILDAELTSSASATGDPGRTIQVNNPGIEDTRGQALGSTGAGVLADVEGSDTYTTSPGTTAATEDTCYTNSPGFDLNIGLGVDALTAPAVPANCLPPPH